MAAIAHDSVVDMTEQTTTNSGFSVLVTEPASSFADDGVYLIVVTLSMNSNSTSALMNVRTRHGSSTFPGSFSTTESRYGNADRKHGYAFMTVFTQPSTAELIEVQFSSQDNSTLVRVEDVVLSWIRLDADLTENTDWFFAEDNDEASPVALTQASFAVFASSVFTPANNNDDWLVMSTARIATLNNSKNFTMHISRNSADNQPEQSYEGEDTSGFMVKVLARVRTLPDSEQTLTLRAAQESDSGGDHEHYYSNVFALNLTVFEEAHTDFITGTIADTESFIEIAGGANLAFTPNTAGDFWVYGSTDYDTAASSGRRSKLRIQSGGTSVPSGYNDANFRAGSHDADDKLMVSHHLLLNLAASAQDLDLDAEAGSGVADGVYENRFLIAFSMELASAGDALFGNIADSVGVTDTLAVSIDYVVAEADTVGVTDTISLVGQFFRTAADNVVVTDTIAPSIGFVKSLADSVGVTDAITTSVGVAVALADSVGVTDVIATIVGNIRLLEDTVDITDVFSRVGTYIRAFADPVGVTDVLATAVSKVISFADSVSVTDTVATSIAFIIGLADTVGVTDVITTLVTITRLLADTVDVTDTVNTVISYVVTLTDTVDVTDVFSRIGTYIRPLADTVDVTDTLSVIINYVITIGDTVDVTDFIDTTVTGAGEFFAFIADTVDVTDTISTLSNYAITLTDTVDIADVLTKVYTGIRSLADTVDVTDVLSTAIGYVISLADTVDVTDAISTFKAIVINLADTVDITDALTTARGIVIGIANTVDITDILSKVGIYIRTVTESVIITDIRTHVGTFIVSLQDSVAVTDVVVALKKIIISLADTVGITDVISVVVTQLVFIISPIELQLKYSKNLQIMIKRGKKIIRELRS